MLINNSFNFLRMAVLKALYFTSHHVFVAPRSTVCSPSNGNLHPRPIPHRSIQTDRPLTPLKYRLLILTSSTSRKCDVCDRNSGSIGSPFSSFYSGTG